MTKTELEKQLESERRQRVELNGKVTEMRATLQRMNSLLNELTEDPNVVRVLARRARHSPTFQRLLEQKQ